MAAPAFRCVCGKWFETKRDYLLHAKLKAYNSGGLDNTHLDAYKAACK